MTVCSGADCAKQASTLKCPVCMKEGLDIFFCDQACFKRNWKLHKNTHAKVAGECYDPFPETVYTGELRAQYPLAPTRKVKDNIEKPDHAIDGQPRKEQTITRFTAIAVGSKDIIEKMRKLGREAREVLDIVAAAVKPGITTEELDRICHEACMERDAYPSPLNYYNFPASCCTSVNEVICHGVPDKRPLKDGDIVNIDVTLYKYGVHSDLNETYYVGDKARADPDIVRLIETTREALELAAKEIKPGQLFRNFGDIIEKHAIKNNVSVVRTYVGHGVGELFHGPPNIPHCKFSSSRA
jgi:methionyl aminopeptidase